MQVIENGTKDVGVENCSKSFPETPLPAFYITGIFQYLQILLLQDPLLPFSITGIFKYLQVQPSHNNCLHCTQYEN
jgi:hypothetical protein